VPWRPPQVLGVEGCTCTEDGTDATDDWYEDLISACNARDTLENNRTCKVPDLVESALASSDDVEAEYETYVQIWPFCDNTICMLDSLADNTTCTITIDGRSAPPVQELREAEIIDGTTRLTT
jgi:hypothetical protein